MVNPTPMSWSSNSGIISNGIKSATPDLIEFNDDDIQGNAELIADILFENISGQELLAITRHDTVNGQGVSYNIFKNLETIQQDYNPLNILRLQGTFDKTFDNFSIKLADKIPFVANGINGENVYLDSSGSIVIDLVNLLFDEQVDVQITSSGTIYEANI
jgi:hypothetical protein